MIKKNRHKYKIQWIQGNVPVVNFPQMRYGLALLQKMFKSGVDIGSTFKFKFGYKGENFVGVTGFFQSNEELDSLIDVNQTAAFHDGMGNPELGHILSVNFKTVSIEIA